MNSMSSDDPDTIRFHRFVPPEEGEEIEAQARFFGVTVDQLVQDIEAPSLIGGGRHEAIHEFHWTR
jgi:hypothetical protein